MSAPLKKPRQARVEINRSHQGASSLVKAGGSDENAHLWVVSYADLLMVLLCFFVLFFSTDKKRVDSVIQRILLTTSQQSTPGHAAVIGKPQASSPNAAGETPSLNSNLKTELQSLQVKTSLSNDNLILDLPDDAYPRGGTHLSTSADALLSNILKQLKPYASEIDLVFIGHTDPTPVSRTKTKRIADNLDLSSERAKNALLRAASLGFSNHQLRIEGDASSRRQSRTLSIRVIDRRGRQ